jgi:hypothetical protein
MTLPRSLPLIAVILSTATPLPAAAQAYRPDREGYPCGSKALTIRQEGPGFAIVAIELPGGTAIAAASARPEQATGRIGLPIGTGVRIDRAILEHAVRHREAIDAPAR